MTTKEYVNLISNGSLSLVKENATHEDEFKLGANEYFAFLFCTSNKTYFRNYIQYRGRFNENKKLKLYDIELNTLANTDEFFLSKIYDAVNYEGQMGRVIIVGVGSAVIVHTVPPPKPVIIPTPIVPPLPITYKGYGALYNWYAATDIRNITNTGWHVPLNIDWSELSTFLGGDAISGDHLKESGTSHWNVYNDGDNYSCFN
jgi:hypothetical protein